MLPWLIIVGTVAAAGAVAAVVLASRKDRDAESPKGRAAAQPASKRAAGARRPEPADQDEALFEALVEADLGEPELVMPTDAQIQAMEAFAEEDEVDRGEVEDSFQDDLNEIPPLPQIIIQILRVLDDPTSSAKTVANIASNDPTLVAAVLRTVNSAMYGLNREITSIEEAVTYLGYTTVRSLVIRLKLQDAIPAPGNQKAYNHNDLWVHSLAVAIVTDTLSRRVKDVDKGFASTLGLLHDIGKLAINSRFAGEVAKLLEQDASDDKTPDRFLVRERKTFGTDHAKLGAYLAARWKLPDDLIAGIELHHHPLDPSAQDELTPDQCRGLAVVYLANQLTKYCHVYCQNAEIAPVPPAVFELLGLEPNISKLLDNRVRGAISRAIFFTDALAAKNEAMISGVIQLHWGEGAVKRADRLLAGGAPSVPRVTVGGPHWRRVLQGDPDVEAADDTDFVPVFSAKEFDRIEAGELKTYDAARFVAPAEAEAVERLVDIALQHQKAMVLPPEMHLPAKFVIRRFAASLLEHAEAGETIEIYQAVVCRRFLLGFRSPALAFERRLGAPYTPEQARTLMIAETANLLNLNWYAGVDSSDEGDVVLLVTAPVPDRK